MKLETKSVRAKAIYNIDNVTLFVITEAARIGEWGCANLVAFNF
jgi:hypothetical protein